MPENSARKWLHKLILVGSLFLTLLFIFTQLDGPNGWLPVGLMMFAFIFLMTFFLFFNSNLREQTSSDGETLKRTQRLLRETEEIGKVGGWEVDTKTGELIWTEEVYRIHEVDRTFHPTVLNAINFYAATSRPTIQMALDKTFNFGEPFNLELEILTAKGNLRWVHAIGKADPDRHRVFGFFQDITDRKNVEIALRRSELQVKSLVEQSPISIQILNPSGQTVQVNQAFENLWGLTLNDLQNYNILQDQQLVKKGTMSYIQKGFSGEAASIPAIQYDVFESFGKLRKCWIFGRIFPLKDKVGNIHSIVVTHEDITERKQAEEALIKAKEEAENANRAKSDFLSNMSHELRTPLNGIIGFIEILNSEEKDPQKKQYLEIMNKCSMNLLALINQVLSLAKIESGNLALTLENFEPASLLKSVQEIYATLATSRGLSVNLEFDPTIPRILYGEKLFLNQILGNLISNSVKFTNVGQITIGAKRLPSVLPQKVPIEFTIKDTGIGINQKKKNSLYTPFEQGEDYMTKHYEGSGLGLAIVKNLIDLLHGEIDIQSEEKVGTTVTFKIVFDAVEAEQATDASSTLAVGQNEPLKKIEIVCAEDDEVNRIIIKKYCSMQNWNVTFVDNGQELLNMLEKRYFQVCLTDVQMPVLNGLAATKIIRTNQKYKNLIIIGQSAFALENQVQAALDAGMDAYLAKPFTRDQLAHTIDEVIKKRSQVNVTSSPSL